MQIQYYPNEQAVKDAMQVDDPLLIVIHNTTGDIGICNIDDAGEHYVLLNKLGLGENNIDNYFRIILNSQEASWTFTCPSNYKGITDKNKRIEEFYKDGINAITHTVKILGYDSPIDIPKRYRRHIDILKDL